MIRRSEDNSGFHLHCDRCHKILATNGKPVGTELLFARIASPRLGRGGGRFLSFCNWKCRIIFSRGRKYWNRKLMWQQMNKSDALVNNEDWQAQLTEDDDSWPDWTPTPKNEDCAAHSVYPAEGECTCEDSFPGFIGRTPPDKKIDDGSGS